MLIGLAYKRKFGVTSCSRKRHIPLTRLSGKSIGADILKSSLIHGLHCPVRSRTLRPGSSITVASALRSRCTRNSICDG